MKSITFLRVCAALALGVCLSAARLHGQTAPVPAPLDFTFGMVGLAPGQTARLSVVNIGSSVQFPCRLVLAFLDDAGKALKQAFVQMDSGKAAFLDLTLGEANEKHEHGPDSGRIQIRGIGYNPLLSPIPISLSCNLVPTLEVFTTETGTTSVILTDSVRLNSIPVPVASSGS